MEGTIGRLPHSLDRPDARRTEATRLIALALDMLDDEREQIVRDYLDHALGALERVRDSVTSDK